MTPHEARAQQTIAAQAAYETAICQWVKQRRAAEDSAQTPVPRRLSLDPGIAQANDAYVAALNAELADVRAQVTNLTPGAVTQSGVRRLELWARGGVRLGCGIGLGLVWSTVGQCLLPEMARAQLGHFALHTCCAGGASDIKRANAPASIGLASKRDYQRKQAEHRAWLAGTFGPLDAPVRTEYRPDEGPAVNPE